MDRLCNERHSPKTIHCETSTKATRTPDSLNSFISMADKVIKNKNCRLANKSSKPLLERQRRARINNSLNELKSLVLSSLYQNCPQAEQNCEKMEKAEILELTVNFLKVIQSRRSIGLSRVETEKLTEFDPAKYEPVNLPKREQQETRRHEHTLPAYSYASVPVGVAQSSACCPVYVTRPSRSCETLSGPRYTIPATCVAPVFVTPHSQQSAVTINSQSKVSTTVATHRPLYSRVQLPASKIQVWRPW